MSVSEDIAMDQLHVRVTRPLCDTPNLLALKLNIIHPLCV